MCKCLVKCRLAVPLTMLLLARQYGAFWRDRHGGEFREVRVVPRCRRALWRRLRLPEVLNGGFVVHGGGLDGTVESKSRNAAGGHDEIVR